MLTECTSVCHWPIPILRVSDGIINGIANRSGFSSVTGFVTNRVSTDRRCEAISDRLTLWWKLTGTCHLSCICLFAEVNVPGLLQVEVRKGSLSFDGCFIGYTECNDIALIFFLFHQLQMLWVCVCVCLFFVKNVIWLFVLYKCVLDANWVSLMQHRWRRRRKRRSDGRKIVGRTAI